MLSTLDNLREVILDDDTTRNTDPCVSRCGNLQTIPLLSL